MSWFSPKGATGGLSCLNYIYPAALNKVLEVAYNKSITIWLKNRYY